MAGEEGDDEERAIELQLELQHQEQKESLAAIDEALASDTSNQELLLVHEELVLAIKDAEEGLLHLKRARLLREADAIASKHVPAPTIDDVIVGSLDPVQTEAKPLEPGQYSVGSKCRFRHSDGRWYDGRIVGLEDNSSARISFLTPTTESMLMCKFFLQQRCRFGSNCRMSHGFIVSVSYLKPCTPTIWQQSLVGSRIWAAPSGPYGIWKEAELESWDENLKLAVVVFLDGSSAKLGTEALSLSEYAQMSDEEEEDDLSSDGTGSTEEEEDSESGSVHQGIGFLEGTQKGVQTETALFATWENHTRGIASKMMASMGYREGMGLGASGQGIVDPITVKVLPPKQSLGHAMESNRIDGNGKSEGKRRSRGGKRKRDKKHAEAARAAKAEQEQEWDMFSFINDQLAGRSGSNGGSADKRRKGPEAMQEGTKKEDRRSLLAYEDKIKELRLQVERLEGTVSRNRNDKVVFEAASRKLNEVHKALADAEATHATASNSVVSKEKEKRWLKF